jgi:hypothetical protein
MPILGDFFTKLGDFFTKLGDFLTQRLVTLPERLPLSSRMDINGHHRQQRDRGFQIRTLFFQSEF